MIPDVVSAGTREYRNLKLIVSTSENNVAVPSSGGNRALSSCGPFQAYPDSWPNRDAHCSLSDSETKECTQHDSGDHFSAGVGELTGRSELGAELFFGRASKRWARESGRRTIALPPSLAAR